jgi:TPR repeat protein
MYMDGRAPKDITKAREYLKKAADNGIEEAKEALAALNNAQPKRE